MQVNALTAEAQVNASAVKTKPQFLLGYFLSSKLFFIVIV